MMPRAALAALLFTALVLLSAAGPSAQPPPARRATPALASLTTRPERTAFTETSRYDDVMSFLRTVDEASPDVHLTTFGYSFEGRPLPLAVVGARDATPESVLLTRRTRVFIQANIHAGEVEGKEATQMLLRALARGEHADWTRSLVLLVAPIYNADGNERVNLTNRGRQHGPVGGMGQRANAQDYDLNRDHMKLDSPEARSLVLLHRRYDPHVAIDLHTTNGSVHAYHLTYSPPLHPNTDPAIVERLRGDWLPAVTRAIKAKDGWDFYYYGNLQGGQSGERGWYTFDHRPRFNNNYVGLRSRFAILGETYAYLPFKDRIDASLRFTEEVVAYAAAHAADIRQLAAEADARSSVGQTLAVRARIQRSPDAVEILLGEAREERNPYSGQMMLRRLDVRKPERMPEFGTFAPEVTERAPRAYLVPPTLRRVVDKLEAHGVRFTTLDGPRALAIEQFRIASSRLADQSFQGHRERTLTGSYEALDATLPGGTIVVPVDQPLGRLVFMLLEPRSDDGLLNWNVLDEALKDATVYPIVRTFAEVR